MKIEAPTKEEIAKALKLLKSHKAAGPDLIPEALKTDIPTVEIIYGLFEQIWKEEKISNDWINSEQSVLNSQRNGTSPFW